MSCSSFSRVYRLGGRKDYHWKNISYRRIVKPHLVLLVRSSRIGSKETRIGFKISRKIGNAVKRNRIKRILKESFRSSVYRNLGKDVIIVLRVHAIRKSKSSGDIEPRIVTEFLELLGNVQKETFGFDKKH